MNIRSKLFLSLIFIAVLSMVISLNFSIISISRRYEKMAKEEIAAAKKTTESIFLENLSDLVRKALFLSELKEIIDNIDDRDELAMALEFKNFIYPNINIIVLDPAGQIALKHTNSSDSFINQENLDQVAFLDKGRDPLIREVGILQIDGQLCMAAVSPVIDHENFALKGFLLLEIPFNMEFTDQIKEKSKTDIIVHGANRFITSTLTDSNGEMVFPAAAQADPDEMVRFQAGGDRYLIESFQVTDFHKKKVGEIFVAANIEKIMEAKKVGISSLLTSSLLIGFFVILTSIWLGNKLTAPIVKLTRGVEAIAGGNYDIRMNIASRDEIGELAEIFNKMSDSLKVQRDEIRDLQQFFEKIVAHSPSAIIIGNESAEVISMNPAAEALLEHPLERLRDKPLFEQLAAFKPLKEDYFKVLLSGNPCFYNAFPVLREDGGEKILHLTIYKIPLPGAPAAVLQIEDISEKFELEEKLLHAKKLGTLGELLSRFTHEFNNLMTSMLGHLGMLKKETGPGHANYKRTLMVEDIALRAFNLGKDILDFSKKEKLKKENVPVVGAIETVVNLLGTTVLKRIDVQIFFTERSLQVLMNKEKFLLALFNVLLNAKDAIWAAQREKGLIRITVDRIYVSKEEKNFVRTKISDNGTGIDAKIINKIFEPYFTTKGEKGTGLGLTTVKEIIEESAGWIEIDVEKDVSTTLTIFLPEHTA
jgi:PAS domain S-box-containing protein